MYSEMTSRMSQTFVRHAIRASTVRASHRMFHASVAAMVNVGDTIPAVPLYGSSPGDEVDLAALTKKGKSVLVFVPGAFSPGCSARHVPGYVSLAPKFTSDKGVSGIYIISGNDAFVMNAWGKELGAAEGTVKYLADPSLKFVSALGLDFDASKFFGNKRSKRAAVVIENGEVTKVWIEPDNTGISVSEAKNVIEEM
ncbi:Redoxin-domain-containing protein [Lipomyces tetrasporus]|uniref:Redoxin-domain-containing protein n=1 Tax=Lipomyces tetrasporus TaxID=54092 RepID=A0AAD7VU80_9ASCO|nr:Redoxin-domain-containing protein [Lipomyces tetrasporus]KAJ8102847.1 Redoxin-domain-containing protein [Lipomyces tetrasporus]